MNFGCRRSEKCVARQRLVPAAGQFTSPTRNAAWLQQVAARFCSVIAPQVPVGFQDEQGFHCGAPLMMQECGPVTERDQ